ncbi:transcriptional regulator [Streptomyces spiroverticillatus]|uniref:Transcriptional regulator n=1 Tax=Streptomyces finlayi TaxID=67296 RepID=A0A919CDV0_9ACTN|nr:DUF397 domain-containing protein [Streptomyces finlayi]GHA43559.1 transcriptional regulator [Streptomyces spiroverticillatus]GHD13307.1 transcriptional regulator [Streptomyces finlayi]
MSSSAIGNGITASMIEGVQWAKAQQSNGQGNCVEVAALDGGGMAVRNSRFPDGPALVFTPAEAEAFLAGAREGQFDFIIG